MSTRPELAQFLRARREALRPPDVGLPDSGRRRTPGLRREEVATLAGVSIDYLVRLEQGRDSNPSASVLGALADALRLNPSEQFHMLKLAAIGHSGELCPKTPESARNEAAPTIRRLLDRFHRTPAFVLGHADDVLAWNQAWAQLAAPLGMLDAQFTNLARHAFLHPQARAVYTDWPAVADERVSRLRAAETRWADDAAFRDLLEDLSAVPDFASRWAKHPVAEQYRGVTDIRHPGVGALRLAYEVLALPDDEQRLVTWLPADGAVTAAFDRAIGGDLPASPAQLRVVGNG